MSGISGIVAPMASAGRITGDEVRRMQAELRHRGPGRSEVWIGHGVALGHQRSETKGVNGTRGSVTSPDGDCRLVLDGHVHSADAVVRRWAAVTDAAAVDGLSGAFALALWQDRDRRLKLVRDPIGTKALYYVHAPDGTLFFASEPKALLAADAVEPALNYAALPDYLATQATTGHETLFDRVRRLPPGHALTWQEGQVNVEAYGHLSSQTSPSAMPDDQLLERLATLLREAVRLGLRDDPVPGALLSGSLGSAALVRMLTGLADGRIRTFSVALAGEPTAQLELARLAARTFGTDHHELTLTPQEFSAALPASIWHQGEPSTHPSVILLHHASALASDHCNAVWTATGCEALFGWDPRYRHALASAWVAGLFTGLPLPTVKHDVRWKATAAGGQSPLARRTVRLRRHDGADVRRHYLDKLAVFSEAEQRHLLTDEARERGAGVDPYAGVLGPPGHDDPRAWPDPLSATHLRVFLPGLARTQDRMSTAVSIEGYAPFLDRALVELAMLVRPRMKRRERVLRYLLTHGPEQRLPGEWPKRTKESQWGPVARWLRGPLRPLLHEYVLSDRALARGIMRPDVVGHLVAAHESNRADHAPQLWLLINLELWHRLYLDGDAARGASRAAAAAI
jgi:asparagine synthase (glutamine-hydrolysing)